VTHVGLVTRHGVAAGALHLLGLLHDGAEWAEKYCTKIAEAAAVYAVLLSNLAPDGHACHQVEHGHEQGEAAQATRVSYSLSIFAEGVAGYEVGDDAEAAVVEAAEQPVLELTAALTGTLA